MYPAPGARSPERVELKRPPPPVPMMEEGPDDEWDCVSWAKVEEQLHFLLKLADLPADRKTFMDAVCAAIEDLNNAKTTHVSLPF